MTLSGSHPPSPTTPHCAAVPNLPGRAGQDKARQTPSEHTRFVSPQLGEKHRGRQPPLTGAAKGATPCSHPHIQHSLESKLTFFHHVCVHDTDVNTRPRPYRGTAPSAGIATILQASSTRQTDTNSLRNRPFQPCVYVQNPNPTFPTPCSMLKCQIPTHACSSTVRITR